MLSVQYLTASVQSVLRTARLSLKAYRRAREYKEDE